MSLLKPIYMLAYVFSKGLHEFLDDLQSRLNNVDDSVNESFFKLQLPSVLEESPQ